MAIVVVVDVDGGVCIVVAVVVEGAVVASEYVVVGASDFTSDHRRRRTMDGPNTRSKSTVD